VFGDEKSILSVSENDASTVKLLATGAAVKVKLSTSVTIEVLPYSSVNEALILTSSTQLGRVPSNVTVFHENLKLVIFQPTGVFVNKSTISILAHVKSEKSVTVIVWLKNVCHCVSNPDIVLLEYTGVFLSAANVIVAVFDVNPSGSSTSIFIVAFHSAQLLTITSTLLDTSTVTDDNIVALNQVTATSNSLSECSASEILASISVLSIVPD
jgi:hypothetical protein